MATKIIMPKQGLQMTEGTIISWLVKEGEKAVKGEPLFEMETDKLTITMDSPETGTVLKIVRGEGDTVPITETIAVVGESGEDISELLDAKKEEGTTEQPEVKGAVIPEPSNTANLPRENGRVFITPRAKMRAEEKGIGYAGIEGSGPEALIIEKDVLSYVPNAITPLAKKTAELNGIDTAAVAGTGTRGKITKEDILNAVAARKQVCRRGETLVPVKGMRKAIAERMVESLHTAAQAAHRISVDMTEAGRLREAYKKADRKLSYNDIVSFAVCRALRDLPIMNSELTYEGILQKDYVNLGIAVAVENGLIVPVIRDADLMRIEEIGEMTRALAEKAKNGALGPDDYKGGTFTISNLGMFGLDSFVAIINPPESGILAVGRIAKIPVSADNDEIVVRPMMELTLTYDHRVVDGAPAAQFLVQVKAYLEQPYLLL